MAKRKRIKIGVPFGYDENWIGGAYYILNLIKSLKLLGESRRPELYVLSWSRDEFERIAQLEYPHLKYAPLAVPCNIPERIVNKLFRISTGRNLIKRKYTDNYFDVVFPYTETYAIQDISNKLHWIPDFQERHFPDFFSEDELTERKKWQDQIAASGNSVVVSSNNAKKDFHKFYPESKCNLSVLNFAVIHPEYDSLNIEQLRNEFNISKPYFMVPNQFWMHKNHLIILKAINLLKEKNKEFQVVFTGKEYDYRNPDYFSTLKQFVDDHGLGDFVRFLGFIDRRQQLKLMSEAIAIVQPSLFEGWGTVVEDAKAMNQYVILSDIDVHREQLDYNVDFFDPHNEKELMSKMTDALYGNIDKVKKDYDINVRNFGKDFMEIVNQTVTD